MMSNRNGGRVAVWLMAIGWAMAVWLMAIVWVLAALMAGVALATCS